MLVFASCKRTSAARPVPWLEIERRRPLIDVPHIMTLGRPEHIIRRRDGSSWQEIIRTPLAPMLTSMSSGEAVLIQTVTGSMVVRAGTDRVQPLPPLCASATVAPNGMNIVCAECKDPGPRVARCSHAEIVEFNPEGKATVHWNRRIDSAEPCGLATIDRIVFREDDSTEVLALECRDTCRVVSVREWQVIGEKPGICAFQDHELSALHLRRGRPPTD